MPEPVARPPRDDLVRAVYPGASLRSTVDAAMPVIEGHFAVFNVWSEINSWWEGNFMERIAPGAFTKTIAENRSTMRLCFQHGMDPQVGDKPLAPIEELDQDKVGGRYAGTLLDTIYVRELIPGLEAGLYGSSFRFRVMKEELVQAPKPSDSNPRGLPERTIQEAQVFELGPVVFPQYPEADSGLRSTADSGPLVRSLTDRYIVARVLGVPMGEVDPTRLREEIEAIRSRATALPSTEPASATPADVSRSTSPVVVTTSTSADPPPDDPPPAEPAPTTAIEARSKTGPSDSPRGKKGTNTVPPAVTTPDFSTLDNLRSIDEMQTELDERRSRLTVIDDEAAGQVLRADAQAEWDRLNAEIDELDRRMAATAARQARLEAIGASDPTRSIPGDAGRPAPYQPPQVSRGGRGELLSPSEIRAQSRSDDEYRTLMRDNAMRSVERAVFPHPEADQARVRSHIEKLLTPSTDEEDLSRGATEIARRILNTGNPIYRKAFGKYLANKGLTPEEQRALSVGTGSAGGFAIVYTLDPTIVPTSNFSVNPFRAISRIETIAGTNEWKAVTSGAISASYAAEATEAGDNAPTLAQPDIIAEKAQAYVPFSIEAGQDWTGLQTEMASLLQDAKDDLEATKFTVGAGHGSNEPKGLITAATNTTTAGGVASFAVADLYKVFEALPPRFRPRARWLANLFTYDKIRQFDTAGGSGVWGIDGSQAQLQGGAGGRVVGSADGNVGAPLLGRSAYESTAMASALTTGSKIVAIGDFRYFVIVDRIGMDIEVMPLVVGTNHRPTGQRGLYAYWRNSSDVLSAAAFQVLVTG